ncbi:hypothetical protein OpiT1DRAFT_05132 [Opitutaceae bacterium TAV1]|nr:hypothetical protein OpiT1DRAFT_05132 [Opitutaceae bacterium TAV1]
MKITKLASAAYVLLSFSVLYAGENGFVADFENAKPETALGVGPLAGWSQMGKATEGAITVSQPGYKSDNALVIKRADAYARHRSATPMWTAESGKGEFSVVFRITGRMNDLNIILSQYGGSGFFVSIKPESVVVSTGGDSVFTATTTTLDAVVGKDTWHVLKISGFQLDRTAAPDAVKAQVFLYEADAPANIVLDGVAIAAAGKAPVSAVNQIDIRRFGGAADIMWAEFDNFRLETAK